MGLKSPFLPFLFYLQGAINGCSFIFFKNFVAFTWQFYSFSIYLFPFVDLKESQKNSCQKDAVKFSQDNRWQNKKERCFSSLFMGFVDKNATLQTKQKGCINRAPENRRTQSEIFGKEEPQAWKRTSRDQSRLVAKFALRRRGAEGGTWTRTVSLPTDFESVTSAIPSLRPALSFYHKYFVIATVFTLFVFKCSSFFSLHLSLVR